MVGRGGTSGIGTAAFEHGGFIVDGGHRFGPDCEKTGFAPSSASKGVQPPPVLMRHDFPVDWRILLAIPALPEGASGTREAEIFRTCCPVPLDEVQTLCHEILMRMLPGIAEQDLDQFGTSVNTIQQLGFKKVELSFQPREVTGLLDAMRAAGAAGAGMSSFGPTLYAIGDTGMQGIERAAQSYHAGYRGRIHDDHLRTQQRRSGTDRVMFPGCRPGFPPGYRYIGDATAAGAEATLAEVPKSIKSNILRISTKPKKEKHRRPITGSRRDSHR